MKLRDVLLSAFIAVTALSGGAYAEAMPQEVAASKSNNQSEYKSVTVYGHELDLGSVKMDEGNDTMTWSELQNMVPRVFLNIDEELSAEDMCTRVFMGHDSVRNKAENYRDQMIAAYAEFYHSQGKEKDGKYDHDQLLFDQEMIDILNQPTGEGVEKLVTEFPRAEKLVTVAREYAQMWGVAEIVHDAAMQNCPEFSSAIGRRSVLSWGQLDDNEPEVVEQPSSGTPKP